MKLYRIGRALFFMNLAALTIFLLLTEIVSDCSIKFVGPTKYFLLMITLPPIFFYFTPEILFYVSGIVLLHSILVMTHLFNGRNKVLFCLQDPANPSIAKRINAAISRGVGELVPNNVIVVLDSEAGWRHIFYSSRLKDERKPATLEKQNVADAVENALRNGEEQMKEHYSRDGRGYFLAEGLDIEAKVGNMNDLRILMGCVQRARFSTRFHGCILVLKNSGFAGVDDKMFTRKNIKDVEALKVIEGSRKRSK